MLKRFDRGAKLAPRSLQPIAAFPSRPSGGRAARLGLSAIAVLALVTISAARRLQQPTRAEAPFAELLAQPRTPANATGSLAPNRMLAVIVAQKRDCNGNLGFASILDRADLSTSIPDRVVLVDGTPQDTAQLRARLPRALARARIAMLQRPQRQALLAFGHRATPVLLLFDAEARLRLSATVSPDPVQVVSLRRAIKHLASNDPLP
jgi:hypothetical protein